MGLGISGGGRTGFRRAVLARVGPTRHKASGAIGHAEVLERASSYMWSCAAQLCRGGVPAAIFLACRELTTGRRSPASPPLTAGLRLPYDDGAGTSAPPGEQFLPMGTPLSRHAGNRRPVKGVNCSFLSSTARFPSEKNSSTVGPGLYHEPRPAVSRGGHGTVPWR